MTDKHINNGANDINNADYEYLIANIKSKFEPYYTECYEGLGWELASPLTYYANTSGAGDEMVELKYRRIRKNARRGELQVLQHDCEALLNEIRQADGTSGTWALILSLTVGVLGAFVLTWGIFSFTNQNDITGVVLIILGLAGCLLAYPVNRQVNRRIAKHIRPVIEKKHLELKGLAAKWNASLS